MNIFWVFNGTRIKRGLILVAACVFAVAVIYVESEEIAVFSQAENEAAIYSVVTDKKWIALTFDISWGDQQAIPIVDVLKENNLNRATFFVSSLWGKDHPEIIAHIQEAGFEIESHGHIHTNYSELSDEDIHKQISTADRILTEVLGRKPQFIRLPNGDFDKRVLKIASVLRYQVIQWDTDSLDWTNPGIDVIVERVVNQAHKGDIVLMHASDSSQQTAEALPIIIEQLRNKGFEFVSVSEMLEQATIEGRPIQD